MKCESGTDKYGSNLYCKTCGMDIGLNPIRVCIKGVIQIYCCEDCAKTR